MRRDNKTEYVVLGLLNTEPMTGYQIRQVVSGTIGYFWQESYGQIYPALKRLHQSGFVSRKIQRQKGKPDRHEYSITAAGRDRLSGWLGDEPDRERVRQELLLKLFFAEAGSKEATLRHVEQYRDRQAELLERFRAIEVEHLKPLRKEPGFPYWYATLSYGIHLAQARLAWAEETIKAIGKPRRKTRSKQT